MKKILTVLVLLWSLFISTPLASAQINLITEVPGINCGVAGDPNISKCCGVQPNFECIPKPIWGFLDFGVNVIGLLPVAGGVLTGIYNEFKVNCSAMENFSKKLPNMACLVGTASTANTADPSCKCNGASPAAIPQIARMCHKYLKNAGAGELQGCLSCAGGGGMWTGLGCVPLRMRDLIVQFIFGFGLSLAFLVALACIVYSAFRMQTSQGNPEVIKKARENLTSCIMGLLLIIFSVFILRFIGITVLKIPFLQ
ncbi:hypothetical protein HY214_02600 [Candidatus Roizmanbacteria bacterium]|nr:hypothetical protein [Candidatus Roizmanbacteria bacterium]